MNMCAGTHLHTNTHTHARKRASSHTLAHAHTRTRTHLHTHTHARSRSHAHAQVLATIQALHADLRVHAHALVGAAMGPEGHGRRGAGGGSSPARRGVPIEEYAPSQLEAAVDCERGVYARALDAVVSAADRSAALLSLARSPGLLWLRAPTNTRRLRLRSRPHMCLCLHSLPLSLLPHPRRRCARLAPAARLTALRRVLGAPMGVRRARLGVLRARTGVPGAGAAGRRALRRARVPPRPPAPPPSPARRARAPLVRRASRVHRPRPAAARSLVCLLAFWRVCSLGCLCVCFLVSARFDRTLFIAYCLVAAGTARESARSGPPPSAALPARRGVLYGTPAWYSMVR